MTMVFTPGAEGTAANRHVMGDMWLLEGTLTFSGSYVAGGDSLDLTKYLVGASTVKRIIPVGDARGNSMEYDITNKKLKLFSSANTEAAAAAHNAALTGSPVPVAFLCR